MLEIYSFVLRVLTQISFSEFFREEDEGVMDIFLERYFKGLYCLDVVRYVVYFYLYIV